MSLAYISLPEILMIYVFLIFPPFSYIRFSRQDHPESQPHLLLLNLGFVIIKDCDRRHPKTDIMMPAY